MTVNEHGYHPEHHSVDRSNRFAIDNLLRSAGFKIASRRKNQQPTWTRFREELTEEEALQSLKWEEVEKAQKQEESYYNQFEKKKKAQK